MSGPRLPKEIQFLYDMGPMVREQLAPFHEEIEREIDESVGRWWRELPAWASELLAPDEDVPEEVANRNVELVRAALAEKDNDLAAMSEAAPAQRWVLHSWMPLLHRLAFLARYGDAAEIALQKERLDDHIRWWHAKATAARPEDAAVVESLAVASQRLAALHATALKLEAALEADGYVFDPESQTLKSSIPGRRGPRRALHSRLMEDAFRMLVLLEGWTPKNTAAMRSEIRRSLAGIFHPDLMTDTAITSAINTTLHPKRHY